MGRATQRSPLARLRAWLRVREHLPRWSIRLAWLCAAVYLLGVALSANPVPRDIGWLGGLCLMPLALAALLPRSALADTWVARGALYVAVVVAVYLDHRTPVRIPLLQLMKGIFLPLLALAVAFAMRLSGERRFEATPLDLLLIFSALVLPNLPGVAGASSNFGLSAAKLVVLCYAVEMISTMNSRLRRALIGTGAVFFVLIAVRAFR